MIEKKEIKDNINTEWKISLESQKEARYGLCRFIIETCQKLNFSNETTSLAMLLTNFFYIKKCYFNFDKLTTACAAILLASKTETSENKFTEICKEYLSFQSKSLNQEGIHKIKEIIGKYEIFLLKELNYNVPEEFPYDLICIYSELLYPDNDQEIANFATKIANDSYFTFVNNIYKSHVVALACIVIAARFLDIPTILDENFKHINNMKKINRKEMTLDEFNKALNQYDNSQFIFNGKDKNGEKKEELIVDEKYFEGLGLCEKLHPNLTMADLLDCIKIIIEFYEDMNAKSNEEANNQN